MIENKFRGVVGESVTVPFYIGSELSMYAYDSIEKFTGLHDKNSKEIYKCDLLRIKRTLGDGKYNSDCIYQVSFGELGGLELRFVRLFGNETRRNQYPIEQTLCERYKSIDIDHKNERRDSLCVPDTYGSNSMQRTHWKQSDWSNDIEVIGNIHENPELING